MDIRKYFAPTKGKKQTEKEKEKSNKPTTEESPAKTQQDRVIVHPSPKKPSSKAPMKSKRRRAVLSDSEEEDDSDFQPDEGDVENDDVMDLCDSDEETPVRQSKHKKAAKPASVPKPDSNVRVSHTSTRPQEKRFKSHHPMLDASGEEAKAAVAVAIEALPGESELKFSVMEGSNVFGGGVADDPPNHGSKEVPRGHPQCLEGQAFVISGVLDSLTRSEAEELIKRHSGRITTAVSGKTSFLLCGENCGNSKYSQAKQKGTKLIDEDGLLSLIRAAPPPAPAVIPSTLRTAADDPGSTSAAMHATGSSASVDNELWVDKYKPRTASELVGNTGLIQELRSWLVNWKKNCAKSKSGDSWKKAVLLTGSPGIGKTSSARIVAQATGFRMLDVNASITRKKSDGAGTGKALGSNLTNSLKIATTTHHIHQSGDQDVEQVLIMDEVDGMGGGDRGGVTDLIDTIKHAKIPIICICNDKYAVKLRSLRNHCQDFTYRKPSTAQISKRMTEICQKEGLRFESSAVLNLLIDAAGGDLRLILGQLQTLSRTHSYVSYDEMKTYLLSVRKDLDLGPFKSADQLLSPGGSKATLSDRLDLVFQDMDLVPLLVQENYLNHISANAFDEKSQLAFAAKAADLIATGELMNSLIRERQEWSLLPATLAVGTVAPAAYMCGKRRTFNSYEMNFTRFTAYLGNMSTKGKQMRLLTETSNRMMAGMRSPLTPNSARLDYIPSLRTLLSQPLSKDGSEGIKPLVEFMHKYCLSKDEFSFVLDVTKFKSKQPWATDPYASVNANVKSAFTRTFNKLAAPVRTSLQIEDPKKGKKVAAAGDEVKMNEGEDPEMAEMVLPKPNQASEDEKSDAELDAEAIIKSVGKRMTVEAKSKRGAKSGGRGRGSARGRGRGRGRGKKRS